MIKARKVEEGIKKKRGGKGKEKRSRTINYNEA